MDALMMREWSALQREATAVDYYYREDVEVQKQQQLIASSAITTAKPTTTTPYVTNYYEKGGCGTKGEGSSKAEEETFGGEGGGS
eukprot:6124138-Ditylum_brightwellii.AAC.1